VIAKRSWYLLLGEMGNGMNKILPGLYLGCINDAQDALQLKSKSITHVLSIHDRHHEPIRDKVHLCLYAVDADNQNLSQYFSQCNAFIHQARVSGGNVLVHCLAGVSRSVTLVIAYLMTVSDLTWHEALCAVRSARACANPNIGFQQQLILYERGPRNAERARLQRHIGLIVEDERNVKKLLRSYNSRSMITFQ